MNLRNDIRKLKQLSDGLAGKKIFSIVIKNNAIEFDNGEILELQEQVIEDIISSSDPKDIKQFKNKIIIKNLDFEKLSNYSLYYIAYEGREPVIIYDDIEP